MITIYDSDCPICHVQKELRVKKHENHPELGTIEHITTNHWGYAVSEDEIIIEAFCSGCGVKFVYLY